MAEFLIVAVCTYTHKPRTLRIRTLRSIFYRTIPALCGGKPRTLRYKSQSLQCKLHTLLRFKAHNLKILHFCPIFEYLLKKL